MASDLERLPGTIRAEQAVIDAALAAGATHLVNQTGDGRRIHTLTCPAVGYKLDRQAAWERDGEFDDMGNAVASVTLPRLMSRDEVEQLPTYRRCRTCCPATDHAVKTRAERSVQVANLTDRHFGRRLVTSAGQDLGTLDRVTVDRWVDRVTVTVHTDTGAYEVAPDTAVFARPARPATP